MDAQHRRCCCARGARAGAAAVGRGEAAARRGAGRGRRWASDAAAQAGAARTTGYIESQAEGGAPCAARAVLLCSNLCESRQRRCACESSSKRSGCSSGKPDSRQSKSAHVLRKRLHKRRSSVNAAASFSLALLRCVAHAAPLRLSTLTRRVQAVQRVGAQRSADAPAAPAPSGDAARRAADDAECSRVLGALTDADALGLRPHPQLEAVKSAYRTLAKRLHPDKCTSARSSAAFQRIARAYQNLTK